MDAQSLEKSYSCSLTSEPLEPHSPLAGSEEFTSQASGSICTHVTREQGTASGQQQPSFQPSYLPRRPCLTHSSSSWRPKALVSFRKFHEEGRTKSQRNTPSWVLSSVTQVAWTSALRAFQVKCLV